MRTKIRRAFIGLGVALVSVPVGFMLTLFLVPFWAWLEATTGIESVGHSGPAEWCYLVIVGALFCGASGLLLRGDR